MAISCRYRGLGRHGSAMKIAIRVLGRKPSMDPNSVGTKWKNGKDWLGVLNLLFGYSLGTSSWRFINYTFLLVDARGIRKDVLSPLSTRTGYIYFLVGLTFTFTLHFYLS